MQRLALLLVAFVALASAKSLTFSQCTDPWCDPRTCENFTIPANECVPSPIIPWMSTLAECGNHGLCSDAQFFQDAACSQPIDKHPIPFVCGGWTFDEPPLNQWGLQCNPAASQTSLNYNCSYALAQTCSASQVFTLNVCTPFLNQFVMATQFQPCGVAHMAHFSKQDCTSEVRDRWAGLNVCIRGHIATCS